MFALLIASTVLSMPQAPQRTLLEQIIPRPTGQNGYEDFLAAADLVSAKPVGHAYRPFDLYYSWRPDAYENMVARANAKPDPSEGLMILDPLAGQPLPTQADLALAKRLDGMTRLQVQSEMAGLYGRVSDLIGRGLGKQISVPVVYPAGLGFAPELGAFKDVAKFLESAVFVRFAEGKSVEAANMLLDLLEFGISFRERSQIHALVSVAMTSIALSSLERSLNSIPYQATNRLIKLADKALGSKEWIIRMLDAELQSAASRTLASIERPDQLGVQALPEVLAGFRTMGAAEREQFVGTIEEGRRRANRQITQMLGRPESEWWSPVEPFYGDEGVATTRDELLRRVLASMGRSESGLLPALAKTRCQLRLLALHGLVLKYRWENQKLPAELIDAVGSERMRDPLSGTDFVYEIVRRWDFRIYSRGNAHSGIVEMRYQIPRSDGNMEPPPLFQRADLN